ncbi:MAG: DUF1428 domain-containing protein [Lautropia sp.]|nr:DUF1428 domain-containing protein [Lautropia sp.]
MPPDQNMPPEHYVDGFLAPVPLANREAYLQTARASSEVFKAHGAVQIVECWGDEVPEGKLTSLPMAVQCQPDETVVFSWIVWPSKAVRDAGWEAAMADPDMPRDTPYDAGRMIYGGFKVILAR